MSASIFIYQTLINVQKYKVSICIPLFIKGKIKALKREPLNLKLEYYIHIYIGRGDLNNIILIETPVRNKPNKKSAPVAVLGGQKQSSESINLYRLSIQYIKKTFLNLPPISLQILNPGKNSIFCVGNIYTVTYITPEGIYLGSSEGARSFLTASHLVCTIQVHSIWRQKGFHLANSQF